MHCDACNENHMNWRRSGLGKQSLGENDEHFRHVEVGCTQEMPGWRFMRDSGYTQVWNPRRCGGCSDATISDAVQKSSVEGN